MEEKRRGEGDGERQRKGEERRGEREREGTYTIIDKMNE